MLNAYTLPILERSGGRTLGSGSFRSINKCGEHRTHLHGSGQNARGVLQIVGLLALLIGGCELLIRRPARLRARRVAVLHRLRGYPPPPDAVCPWPRLEPEVERLRETGAL